MRDRSERLLAVFAHPDDESYGAAGTLLRVAERPDSAVMLLCLTSGEASTVLRDQGLDPSQIRALREARMAEVAEVLGIDELSMPRLPDGGLSRLAFDALSAPVRAAIDSFDPQVVISQDERGINGHADHIAAHWAVRDVLRNRPDVRFAMVVYPPSVTNQTDRLMFPTPREEMDVLVALTNNEIAAKQRCLDIHGAAIRITADTEGDVPSRPPIEHYDLFGEAFDPPLADLFERLPSRNSA